MGRHLALLEPPLQGNRVAHRELRTRAVGLRGVVIGAEDARLRQGRQEVQEEEEERKRRAPQRHGLQGPQHHQHGPERGRGTGRVRDEARGERVPAVPLWRSERRAAVQGRAPRRAQVHAEVRGSMREAHEERQDEQGGASGARARHRLRGGRRHLRARQALRRGGGPGLLPSLCHRRAAHEGEGCAAVHVLQGGRSDA